MDGFEATEQIRSIESREGGPYAIPIIALTAGSDKEDREKCQQAGMNGFISPMLLVGWNTPMHHDPQMEYCITLHRYLSIVNHKTEAFARP